MGKASKVWKFLHKSPQNKDKVTCEVCDATLSSKGGVTTPLINHLKTHKQAFAELFVHYSNYSNSWDRIPLFGIRIRSIFKTRIYLVFSIRSIFKNRTYSVFGPNLLFGPTLPEVITVS